MRKSAVFGMIIVLAVTSLTGCSLSGLSAAADGILSVDKPTETTVRKMIRGKLVKKVFTSSSAGVTFTLPEGWTYATDEELAKLETDDAASLTDEEKTDLGSKKYFVIEDMKAVNDTTGDIAGVLIEKQYTNITASQYVRDSYDKALASAGGTGITLDSATMKPLAGRYWDYCSMSVIGSSFIMNAYAARDGEYMIIIYTADTDTDDGSMDIIKSAFAPLQ